MHRGFHLAAGLTLVLAACQPAAKDESATAADAIRAADAAWSKVFSARDTSAAVAAVEPGGSILPPNGAIATGPEAIRKLFEGFYGMPAMTISWSPNKVEAARSGELGFSSGTYEMSYTDPKGKPATDHGKYVTIWRKQADGSWKVVLDTFNSDLPLAGPGA
jgi:ketosteroid isomerase-like protein